MENIVPEKASRANLSETGAVQIELKRKMVATKQNHEW